MNVDSLAAGDVDADGADEVVGDFGASGCGSGTAGLDTTQRRQCGICPTANLDGTGGDEIIGDFGAIGLWIGIPASGHSSAA